MRRTLILGTIVLPIALVACGDEQTVTVEATPAAMAAAAARTLDEETGRLAATITAGLGDGSYTVDVTGAYDGPAGLLALDLGLGELLDGLAERFGGGALDELGGPMQLVVDGDQAYVCGDLVGMFTGGRPCGSVDAGDMAAAVGSAGGIDPTAFLRGLVGSDEVAEVGPEEVDGVPVRHFAGTYTVGDALEDLPPEVAAALEGSYADLGDIADAAIPFDVWIDDDGHVRRVTQELAVAGVDLRVDQRYFDFGDEVDIEVPDPGDVADLGDLLGG
jgi:hypothetical protein